LRLTPATTATSAALLTDEPFGVRELTGAVLIVAACGSEFFARDSVD